MNDTLRSLQAHLDDPHRLQQCRATDFCQAPAPDARWQSVRHVWRTGTRLNWDDHGPQVIRAIRFLHAAQSQDSSQRLQELSQTDPIMIEAMKLHQADRLRQLELQCRILARQTSAEIAYEINTEPAAVTFYEDLFFDVRDELDRGSDHLYEHVIGLSLTGPSSIESYARLTAYRNGPGTIPAWLDYFPHRHEEHDLTTESGRQRESIAQYLKAEALLHGPTSHVAAIPYLDEIQYHFSQPPAPRSVASIIQSQTHALLRETQPETEENADVVPLEIPTPEPLVPLIA